MSQPNLQLVFSVASNDKSPTILKAENLKAPHLQKQKKKIKQETRQDGNLSLAYYSLLGLD